MTQQSAIRKFNLIRTMPKVIIISALFLCVITLHQATAEKRIVTIATMEELTRTFGSYDQAVLLLGYHSPGDNGGGLFRWAADSEVESDGGTVIAVENNESGRWKRMADDVKVTYFGARGDGETDDTAAVQAAIDSVSSTAPPGAVYEDWRRVGGTIHFPAGKYRISDTLLIGPQTTLTGVGSSGFQRRGVIEQDHGSVIIGNFEDPRKWMISTAVYYRGGERNGELIPYRRHIGGSSYDRVRHSRANGVRIQNLFLIGEKNEDNEPPYGGIRIQAGPNSVIQGVGVVGVDVAYMFNAGWGMAIRDSFSQSYLYGLLALYSVNGLHIDNCYINGQSSERLIDDSNIAPGPDPRHRGRTVHMPDDYPYKKTGILTHYGHNITLNNVITEHWDIARFHIHGAISDTGSWLEGNRELGYALVSVKLDLRTPNIHAPGMIREGRFMRAGTNVTASINQSPPFPITYASRWQNKDKRITVNAADPDREGWRYYPFVSYPNQRKGHIRVAGDNDEEVDNFRLADTISYVDLTTALRRIAASEKQNWKITVKDGAVSTLTEPIELEKRSLTLVREEDGERPLLFFQPDSEGRACLLRFRNGGALKTAGIDLAVDNPHNRLDSGNRGLISVEGGYLDIKLTDTKISLVDQKKAPDQNFSLIQDTGRAAMVQAKLINVVFDSGHSLFEAHEVMNSSFSCTAVDSVIPQAMRKQSLNCDNEYK